MNNCFLTLEQWPLVMTRVESVFYAERRLPEQVFKQPYQFYLMCELDSSMGMGGILQILQKFRPNLANDTVQLCALDPHPVDNFYKRFGKVSAFTFKANLSEQDYAALRWQKIGDEQEALMFVSNIETYIPSSGAWAMWGELSPEIGVFGFDDPKLATILINDPVDYWMDAESAINGFASQPYSDQKAPEDFARALIENYGSRAELEAKLGKKIQYPWELEDQR